MEKTQYSKLMTEIPEMDYLISMGCNVTCPSAGRAFDEDWGLEDPTGKPDEFFVETIEKIREKVLMLQELIIG